jgi:2-polyprenyl-3-methyl-5-hydroxy-6-metoxy-1,4-benzoquinol methylase
MDKSYLTKTYQENKLKNRPHRMRLNEIFSILEREGIADLDGLTYADFGCATGFITNLVAEHIEPEAAYGFCHSDNIEIGRREYPHINFGFVELTEPSDIGKYKFCTCFETLEHVGKIEIALDNLVRATEVGGMLLVTVPIEIGVRGLAKFLAKTLLYKYDLDELPGEKLYGKYLLSLIFYRDMSRFRDERFGWGTHFGFDYRVIDRYLRRRDIRYRSYNKATTRYYLVYP